MRAIPGVHAESIHDTVNRTAASANLAGALCECTDAHQGYLLCLSVCVCALAFVSLWHTAWWYANSE